jgi:hypothetical protein
LNRSLFDVFRDGGPANYVVLMLAMFAMTSGVVALSLAIPRSPRARLFGLISLGVSTLALAVGVWGCQRGRTVTRSVVEMAGILASERERILRMGFEEASSCLKVALVLTAVPILLALVAALLPTKPENLPVSSAETSPFAPPPVPVARPVGASLVAIAAAFVGLGVTANLVLLRDKPPVIHDIPLEDPRWELLDVVDLMATEPLEACRRLDHVLGEGVDPKGLPETASMPASCATKMKEAALAEVTDEEKIAALEDLQRARYLDLKAREEIRDEISKAQQRILMRADSHPQLSLSNLVNIDSVTVEGALPFEVVRRILRQQRPKLWTCFAPIMAKDPQADGVVEAAFVIGPAGSVTSAEDVESPIASKEALKCTLAALRTISYPSPEKGSARARVRLTFHPTPRP